MNHKILTLTSGIYLQIGYCEKNRPPVYQIDFVIQPSSEWISLKMPMSFSERFGNSILCYKAGQSAACEPLTDIQILMTQRKRGQQKQIFVLPAGYKIINNNPITPGYLIYKRMRSPLEQTFKAMLLQKYPQQKNSINYSMLNLFCFPEGIHLSKQLKGFITFNFILTTQTGQRIFVNCLCFKESMEDSIKDILGLPKGDKIYYQKAICLLSKYRYTDQFSECLKHLYRLSMSKNDVPFFKVVNSFIDNMIVPKEKGIQGMSYSYGGSNINFDTSLSYPIASECAIYCVFKFLPIRAIISIFQAMLLQKKIIFVSQSKTVLGYAIQAFMIFVFPFRWEHVVIPILPSTLKQYMNAPVPIIVGISPSMVDSNIQSDSLIVQMDTGTIHNDEDLPPLPDKMEKQLIKRLQNFQIYDQNDVKQYLENPQSTYIFKMQTVQHPQFQGHLVRDCFLQFILTLMKNYKKFWKTQKYKQSKQSKQMSSIGLTQPQLLNDIFKLQDFLSDLGMTKVGSFGYIMSQATIFTSFIERRHQYLNDPQLIFFDQAIDKKKSKKQIKLIQKVSNIRYNVAKHPQPQAIKTIYVYDRFPSILGTKKIIKQNEIHVQIQQVNEQLLQILEQFLQMEFKQNGKMFPESQSNDIDYKIQSLLFHKYRLYYTQFCEGLNNNRNQTIRTSISKIKNNKQIYDKLVLFQKLYLQQSKYIESIFYEWPYQTEAINIKQIDKRQYISKYTKLDSYNDNQLYCVYEEYFGYKYRNYQIMIKGNTKIFFLQRQSKLVKTENLRNSRNKIKYHYEIYFQHFKLKNFVNKVIPIQAHSLFNFIIQKTLQGNTNVWTLQQIVDWKKYLIDSNMAKK